MSAAEGLAGGLAVGVDVGGTKVAAGLVDAHGVVLARAELPTPATAQGLDQTVAKVVAEVRAEATAGGGDGAGGPVPVGVATAGLVDPVTGAVRLAVNLPWTGGHPVRQALAGLLGCAVSVDNDAKAAAWAEYRFGAGAGARALVVVTLGTGLGGGIVLEGRLHRGAGGAAGEFGHMCLVPDGRLCGCGRLGCWERYACGTALTADAAQRYPGGARQVAEAARTGAPYAVELLAEQGRRLGQGVAMLSAALDPDVVVVGGGLSALGDLILAPARQVLAELLGPGTRPPVVRAAALGNDAGLVGAADLARLG